MPDTNFLLASLIFSSIGLGYFIYGRKQKQRAMYYAGIGLMVYPYFISAFPVMVIIGLALMAAPRYIRLS